MSGWADSFVAVDWGTTNRRAYLIERGKVLDEMEDDLGVLSVSAGGFPAAVAELRQRFGERPLLLAGMVGSDRGWAPAPYVPCPAAIADLADHLERVEPWAAIVPGLSIVAEDHGDVMRGEEVQLFGLRMLGPASRTTVCHPGTHTKWAQLEEGRVARFRTIMTGELFSLLRKHSILAPLIAGEVHADDSFLEGVERGFAEGALGAELFGVRADVLLGRRAPDSAASFTSGLLIGCDVRTGLALEAHGDLAVVGRPSLIALYAAAIRHTGREAREVDGRDAFIAGMTALAETLS